MVTMDESVPLTFREAASGALGSISLACWVFVLVPQLIENYKNGNAEAISILFILIWFVGDVTNLIGSLWAGLVPVVVVIAVYYVLADGILIAQCFYYKHHNSRHEAFGRRRRSSTETPDPTTPLLGRHFSDGLDAGSAAAQRGAIVSSQENSLVGDSENPLAKMLDIGEEGGRSAWVRNTSSCVGICLLGLVGWVIAWQMGLWTPAPQGENGGVDMAAGAQVLGYISAMCYLGARLPQIWKNYREKSCEGLSLLFFLLSILGNLTYGAGILCHSTDKNYFLTNLPWLIGSLGTMAEDVMIFVQFRLYAVRDPLSVAVS